MERFCFFRVPAALGLGDLIFEEQFFFRNSSFESGLDFRDLLLLLVRQGDRGRLFLEAFHRQFISRFHLFLLLPLWLMITLLIQSRKAKTDCGCKFEP